MKPVQVMLSNLFFSFWKSRHLWNNVEKYGTARNVPYDNLIRRICFVFQINKAIYTHSECAICTVFPRQQRLREGHFDSYIACLVHIAISSIQALQNLRSFTSRNLKNKKVNNEGYHFVTVRRINPWRKKAQWDESGGRICWQATQETERSRCGLSRCDVYGFGFQRSPLQITAYLTLMRRIRLALDLPERNFSVIRGVSREW